MQDRIAEIQSFLDHRDLSLAARRMLDLTLDSENEQLLHEAVDWSKRYRKNIKENVDAAVPENFYSEAYTLLKKLEQLPGKLEHYPKPLLQANGITKTYNKGNFSLQPINLEVSTGQVMGIVGENGNGKTTLLRCIAGQLSIDDGNVQYTQLNNPDHYSIKHHLAFIPQRIPRWYGLLKDNLHFSAALSGITGSQNETMVDFMLERMNLSHYAHLTWNQISSGYRTRFEIARVLLQKPALLVLDEPLANLDIIAQQTILTDLRYLAKSVRHPMGILLSSQQLHEVEKIADTVLFIKQGNCLHRTGQKETVNQSVLEIETTAGREELLAILGDENVQVQYNGGYYTLSSTSLTANDMVFKLVSKKMPISYFRDITHSTKRFF